MRNNYFSHPVDRLCRICTVVVAAITSFICLGCGRHGWRHRGSRVRCGNASSILHRTIDTSAPTVSKDARDRDVQLVCHVRMISIPRRSISGPQICNAVLRFDWVRLVQHHIDVVQSFAIEYRLVHRDLTASILPSEVRRRDLNSCCVNRRWP